MTIGGSVALIVIGAILTWGITWQPTYVDLQAIGVILMIAGVAGLIISVAFTVNRAPRAGQGRRLRGAPLHRAACLTPGGPAQQALYHPPGVGWGAPRVDELSQSMTIDDPWQGKRTLWLT